MLISPKLILQSNYITPDSAFAAERGNAFTATRAKVFGTAHIYCYLSPFSVCTRLYHPFDELQAVIATGLSITPMGDYTYIIFIIILCYENSPSDYD